jgi:hypothetical protein
MIIITIGDIIGVAALSLVGLCFLAAWLLGVLDDLSRRRQQRRARVRQEDDA